MTTPWIVALGLLSTFGCSCPKAPVHDPACDSAPATAGATFDVDDKGMTPSKTGAVVPGLTNEVATELLDQAREALAHEDRHMVRTPC